MNGNWSEDNRKRRERWKGGGRDQFTSDVLFSCPYFLTTPQKIKIPF